VRKELKFGENKIFKPEIEIWKSWNFLHQPPGSSHRDRQIFYEGIYEMQHLPIPAKLQKNIEFQFYESGHMVYARAAS
jgi:carboxypeptidase C (cathepsin A)